MICTLGTRVLNESIATWSNLMSIDILSYVAHTNIENHYSQMLQSTSGSTKLSRKFGASGLKYIN